eukprot:CAMPEP_0184312580 /NCGR_PEP_ID=MMETSP1049-20130417/50688_1 /TAXON_ID=77928 /ORGANISM="Proteomonas sulcata, Strain CCMP704" /LENGTH=158 /DNA_ID=CAMNT_0026628835 /DNA_START=188 /DNA_END=664 /DNA_ORIENTATION=+
MLVLGVLGLLCSCIGGKTLFAHLLLNALALGLLVDVVATTVQFCTASCDDCDPSKPSLSCPDCCESPAGCKCDWLRFLVMGLGLFLQVGGSLLSFLALQDSGDINQSDTIDSYQRMSEAAANRGNQTAEDPNQPSVDFLQMRARLQEEARTAAGRIFG